MTQNMKQEQTVVKADKQQAFDQYKMLVDSINTLNGLREQSNSFWIVVNSMTISAVAFVREAINLDYNYKIVIVGTILGVGILLCFSWLSYLAAIKEDLFLRQEILLKMEKQFPAPIFSTIVQKIKRRSIGGESLTFKEMFVPGLFLIGYLFFVGLLVLIPQDVTQSPESSSNSKQ